MTDSINTQVQASTHLKTTGEFHHLLSLDVLEAIDTSDTISNGQYTASFFQVGSCGMTQDALFQDGGDFS